LDTIQKDPNINRYLSSLSKFFQFAIDQHLISVDPLKKAQKPKTSTPADVLHDYQSFLSKKHFSASTIKNYLNDIQQFIDWTQNKSESI
jgi:site-specific recombinase XerD